MNPIEYGQNETLRKAAQDVTRSWPAAKADMALRAAGLGGDCHSETLDAIAADAGKSRETVRRARNDLYVALAAGARLKDLPIAARYSLPVSTALDGAETPAIGRALRRLLTMTGPLPWDEVLAAWARARGRSPYTPLPTDTTRLRDWAEESGGLVLGEASVGPVTIAVKVPEELDQVSQFLFDTLRGRPSGLDRSLLLELAASADLKPTTIATTLSQHPAVIRLGRGIWALRGSQGAHPAAESAVPRSQKPARARPTSFGWAGDGSLRIEFSLPRGPSPVIAVPVAVADLVEGRDFNVQDSAKTARISVRNARLWGFGALVSELGLVAGTRATVALNLITGTAAVTPAERKDA